MMRATPLNPRPCLREEEGRDDLEGAGNDEGPEHPLGTEGRLEAVDVFAGDVDDWFCMDHPPGTCRDTTDCISPR